MNISIFDVMNSFINYCSMVKKLTKKEKKEVYGRLSKYLEDVSKLIMAGIVLSTIM